MGSVIRDYSKLTGRIALFGGTFDPIQCAHVQIAELALERFELTQVLFLPARQNPLKSQGPIASDRQRLEMLQLALQPKDEFKICDLELKRIDAEPSFTIETVKELKRLLRHPHDLFVLIGSDNLSSLHRWKDITQLLELIYLPIIINRQDGQFEQFIENLTPELQPFISKFKAGYLDISPMPQSSTQIRLELSSGGIKDRNLLPEAVLNYIKQEQLYCQQRSTGI